MFQRNFFKQLALASCVAGALSGFAPLASASDQIIKIDGSSTVYPISEAVAEEFQKAKKGAVKVTVGISGTGGGFKKFCRGEIDISDASRPILKKIWKLARKPALNISNYPWLMKASPWW